MPSTEATPLTLRIISRAEAESCVAQFADACYEQRCSYAETAARAVSATCEFVAIEREGGMIGFAAVRIRRIPLIGLGLAYVARGPVTGDPSPETWTEAVDALRTEYVTRRGLVLRIAPPLDQRQAGALLSTPGLRPVPQSSYRTFVIDLTQGSDAIRKALHPKWRNQLVAYERGALQIVRTNAAEGFARFKPLFDGISATKGFSVRQGPAFFADVASEATASERIAVHLAVHEGRAVAGHVGSYSGNTAVYLLGASDPVGRSLRAAYALQWAAIGYAQSLGQTCYDLGGIDEVANPDVFRFKQRMGGKMISAGPVFDHAPNIRAKYSLAIAERTKQCLDRWR